MSINYDKPHWAKYYNYCGRENFDLIGQPESLVLSSKKNKIYIDSKKIDIKYNGMYNGSCLLNIYYKGKHISKYVAYMCVGRNGEFLSVRSQHQAYNIETDIRYQMVDVIKEYINHHGGLKEFRKINEGTQNLSSVKGSPVRGEFVSSHSIPLSEKTGKTVLLEMEKEEVKMNNKVKSSLSTAKSEALEATKRESVDAAWDVLKNGVIQMGLEGLSDDRKVQAKEFLDTKLGDMILRVVVGAAFEQIASNSSADIRVHTLTKELRVQGYQAVLGTYTKPMTAIINEALKQMNPFMNALENVEKYQNQ